MGDSVRSIKNGGHKGEKGYIGRWEEDIRRQRNRFDMKEPYSDERRAQKSFTMGNRWKTKTIAGATAPLGSPDHRWIEDVIKQMIKISE